MKQKFINTLSFLFFLAGVMMWFNIPKEYTILQGLLWLFSATILILMPVILLWRKAIKEKELSK